MKPSLFASAFIVQSFVWGGAALAQTLAAATTDLNVRSGPGPEFEVIGLIKANQQVTVNGCLSGSKWCTVEAQPVDGWVYSDYLVGGPSGSAVVLSEGYADVGVPVVDYDGPDPAGGAAAGAVTGAVAGALIGGPPGAAVGAVAGGAIGGTAVAAINPPDQVRTYVTSNPVEPVYLEGEVVVGAAVPETVQLRVIPDYEYRYVYVNRQPVIVEPGSRRIVYVVR
jgi:uncharacterized protein YraI